MKSSESFEGVLDVSLVSARDNRRIHRPSAIGRAFLAVLLLAVAGIAQAAAPPVPGLQAPTYSQGTYTVTWGSYPAGLDYFVVEERVNNGYWVEIISHSTTDRSHTFSKSNGTYSYRVHSCRPINNGPGPAPDPLSKSIGTKSIGAQSWADCSAWSSVKSVGVYAKPGTSTMTGINYTDPDGTYSVYWSEPSGAITYYKLWEKKDSAVWKTVALGKLLLRRERAFTAEKADAVYQYKAQACNPAGCGDNDPTPKIVTVLKTPTVPTNVQLPATDTSGSFAISWDASFETVEEYRIYRRLNVTGTQYELVGTTPITSYVPSGVHPDGRYLYRISACNETCSSQSGAKSIEVLKVPTLPTNVALTDGADSGTFTLSWDPSFETVDYYEVHQAIEGEFCPGTEYSFCNIGTVTTPSMSFHGLEDGTYAYKVKACNENCSERTISVGLTVAKNASGLPDAEPVHLARLDGELIGSLAEQTSIDGGKVNYSVAIPVPPGRQGMAPAVSLEYSSGAGNGIAGMGWSLSAGQGSIYRCPSLEAIEGETRPYTGFGGDRLCFNGQQLKLVDGDNYGYHGTKYHTEVQSFATVEQLGAHIGGSGAWFKVTDKSGVVSYYDEAVFPPRADGSTSPYPTHWLLTRVVDLNGNRIDYHYTGSSQERLLHFIRYTGKGDNEGDRSVSFVYGERPQRSVAYNSQGMRSVSTKRLERISTFINVSTGGDTDEMVNSFALRYDASDATGRSLLVGVQLCESADSATCYPESVYSYSDQASGFADRAIQEGQHSSLAGIGDVDGDGQADYVLFERDNAMTAFEATELRLSSRIQPLDLGHWMNEGLRPGSHADSGDFDPSSSLDFNSDGRNDLVRRNSDGKFTVGVWNIEERRIDELDTNLTLGSTSYIREMLDVDRDGDTDVVTSNEIYFNCSGERTDLITFCEESALLLPGLDHHDDMEVVDLNGDLLPDMLFTGTSNSGSAELAHVRFGKMIDGLYSLGALKALGDDLGGPARLGADKRRLDVNGDGLTDFFAQNYVHREAYPTEIVSQVWLNAGNNRFAEVMLSDTIDLAEHLFGGLIVADYDGDGRDDLLVPDSVTSDGNFCYLWFDDPDDNLPREACSTGAHQFDTTTFPHLNRGIYKFDQVRFLQQPGGSFALARASTPLRGPIHASQPCDSNDDGLFDLCYSLKRLWAPKHVANCVPEYDENGCYWPAGSYQGSSGATEGYYSQESDRPQQAFGIDVLTQATNGIGLLNTWAYGALSGTGHGSCTYADDAPFYRVDPDLASPGHFHFNASMHVVTRHETTNGVGGTNAECFRFENAMFSTGGRGFQGFKAIIVDEDLEDGHDMSTRTAYWDEFPLTGKPFLVQKRLRSDDASLNPLSESMQSWAFLEHDTVGVYTPYLLESTDTTYNFDSPGREPLTRTYMLNLSSQEDLSYGNAGEQTLETWTLDAQGTTVVHNYTRTEQDYDYSVADSGWTDKLDRKTLTVAATDYAGLAGPQPDSASNSDKVITKDHVYYTDGTRQLKTKTVQAGVFRETRFESYEYDDYGNVTGVSSLAPGFDNRVVSSSFAETQGYFPYVTTDAAGFATVQVHSAAHGQLTDAWSDDGTMVTMDYDFAGKLKRTEATPGTKMDVVSQWCDQTDCGAAVVRNITVMDGTPETIEDFDVLGRMIKTRVSGFADAGDTMSSRVFDRRGRLLSESQPSENTDENNGPKYPTTYEDYDALGRYGRKVVDRTGHAVPSQTWQYQHDGLSTTITMPGGELTASRSYDASQRLLSTTDAVGSTTHHRYDGFGKLILTQNEVGTQVRHYYDNLGRKVQTEDPDAGTASAAAQTLLYNGFGELTETVNAKGQTIENDYDSLGRAVKRKLDGDIIGEWIYGEDATAHQLQSVASGDANDDANSDYLKEFWYDEFGRPVRTEVTIEGSPRPLVSKFGYDSYYNRLKGRTYPSGETIGYDYDRHGILYSARSAWTGADGGDVPLYVLEATNPRGQPTQVLYGNAIEGGYGYVDSTGYAAEITYGVAGADPLAHLKYRYDDAFGNLSVRESVVPGVTESFTYDDLQRLDDSSKLWSNGTIAPHTVDYDYDAIGNLTKKDDFGDVYHYGSVNRDAGGNAGPHAVREVVRPGNLGVIDDFEYDDAGNMTIGNGRVVEYDVFNKPVRIQQGADVTTLQYAPDLSLAARSAAGITTYYDDGYQMVVTAGDVAEERTFAAAQAVIETGTQGRKLRFQHHDRLGSLVLVTDETGAATERHGFDAFGRPLEGDWQDTGGLLHTGTAGQEHLAEKGFTGHEHLDRHKLVHMGGRIYDPQLGRFMSVDPFIQSKASTQSQNAYSYVMNNPLSGVDPSGYATCTTEQMGACLNETGEHTVNDSDGNYVATVIVTDNGKSESTKSYMSPSEWREDRNSSDSFIVGNNASISTNTADDSDSESAYDLSQNIGEQALNSADDGLAGVALESVEEASGLSKFATATGKFGKKIIDLIAFVEWVDEGIIEPITGKTFDEHQKADQDEWRTRHSKARERYSLIYSGEAQRIAVGNASTRRGGPIRSGVVNVIWTDEARNLIGALAEEAADVAVPRAGGYRAYATEGVAEVVLKHKEEGVIMDVADRLKVVQTF